MSSIDPTAPPTPLSAPEPSPASSGLFVTFEGGDGGGKSTQIQMLAEWLQGPDSPLAGAEVVVTKEPGGTPFGSTVRELVLHSDHVATRAEALLYAADRAHHVETRVRPALEAGQVVLSDRYLDSSVAYQGAGRALDPMDVRELSLWAVEGLLPHVTILLDVSAEVFAERRDASSHDRLESAGREFHEAVRATFLDLARSEPERWIVIDAAESVEEVHAQVTQKLTDWLRAHDHLLMPPNEHPVAGADPESLL